MGKYINMRKLLYGVGNCDKGEHLSSVNGRKTKAYSLWSAMLYRCYDKECHKKNPTYIGCTVSEDFKSFQYFAGWCPSQIGFGNIGWNLDKDLLIKGNKQYNKDCCVFVPQHINTIINQNPKTRGEFAIGVAYEKNKSLYKAQGNLSRPSEIIGYYKTEIEAYLAYKSAKESYVKQVAEKWKAVIDPRVYEALMVWEV